MLNIEVTEKRRLLDIVYINNNTNIKYVIERNIFLLKNVYIIDIRGMCNKNCKMCMGFEHILIFNYSTIIHNVGSVYGKIYLNMNTTLFFLLESSPF